MSLTRRDLIKGAAAATAAGAATVILPAAASTTSESKSCAESKRDKKKPNVILVFPDNFRAQALGFMNEDPSITPRLNQFAKESVVFTQAVSNFPLCSPFRGMMLTGQYPYSNGVQGNTHVGVGDNFGGADFGIFLKENACCWSDVLKEQGYSQAFIGKWHLDAPEKPYIPSRNNPRGGRMWNAYTPEEKRHGFDFWYSYGAYDDHNKPMYWTNDTPRMEPFFVDQWSAEHEADIAIDYLRNTNGKYRDPNAPFSMVIAMNPPHEPFDQVPDKYLNQYADKTSRELNNRPNVDWDKKYKDGMGPEAMKNYLGQITGVDDQFGRILDEVKALDLEEDTLIVFCSDHGSCMGSNGYLTKNNHTEESMRIPMIFHWKGQLDHKFDDILFSAPDIFPTMFGLMGLEDEIPDTVEGFNYARTVQGKEGDNRPTSQLYLYTPYGGTAFGRRGVRTDKYTLVIDRKVGKPLDVILHDNINDPYQMVNIAKDNQDIVKQLIDDELRYWLDKTGDTWQPSEVPEKLLKAYS